MLRGMRDQRRCCVATLGDGASQLPEAYDSLHASLIIWLGRLRRCCHMVDGRGGDGIEKRISGARPVVVSSECMRACVRACVCIRACCFAQVEVRCALLVSLEAFIHFISVLFVKSTF